MGTPTRCRGLRALPIGALLAGVLSIGAPASAQQVDPQALGPAQAIFDSAEQLMAEHRYGDACPKVEEVVRLVPSGVGAKVMLAKCYEGAGRLASAWAAYVVAANAASAAGQVDRAKAAAQRAAALKPRVPTLAISVPASLRGLPGLAIQRDGKVLSPAEWGLAVPVDPGAHLVEATAPKKQPWRASAEVRSEADAASIALPENLGDALDAAPSPPPSVETPAPLPPPPGPRGGVPAWAWTVGGVAVALVGTSVGFLVDWRVAQASIDASCPGGKACLIGFDAHGANARLYRDFGAFIGTVAAGVLAGGAAAAGIATAPKRTKGEALAVPRPWLGPGAAGVAWEGRF